MASDGEATTPATQGTGSAQRITAARSLLITGLILGVGIAGSLDEILVHQLLQ